MQYIKWTQFCSKRLNLMFKKNYTMFFSFIILHYYEKLHSFMCFCSFAKFLWIEYFFTACFIIFYHIVETEKLECVIMSFDYRTYFCALTERLNALLTVRLGMRWVSKTRWISFALLFNYGGFTIVTWGPVIFLDIVTNAVYALMLCFLII